MNLKTLYIFLLFFIYMPSAFSYQSENSKLDEIARLIASDVAESFPHIIGQVLSVKEPDCIYINLGEKDNIKKGDHFEIWSQGKNALKNAKDEILCYVGEKIATVEVEWLEYDYAFAIIKNKLTDKKILPNYVAYYVQPSKAIFIKKIKGQFGEELSERITPYLAQISNVTIINSETACDYFIEGDISKKTYGLIARLFLFEKSGSEPVVKIERRLDYISSDFAKPVIGKGFKAWYLPPQTLDFLYANENEIIILSKSELLTAYLTSGGIDLGTRFKFDDDEKIIIREPIGRIQMFDLDNDNNLDMLTYRAGFDTGQFFSYDNNIYTLEGIFPKIPLSADNKDNLLISELLPDYNLFDPSKTYIISISSDGFMKENNLQMLTSSFADASLVEVDGDNQPEIAFIFPDGKMRIYLDNTPDSSRIISVENTGLGIYQDDNGFIYTSSNDKNTDYIIKWSMVDGKLVKQSQSPSVPYRIFRIKNIESNIAGLGFDNRNSIMLIIFDEF